jgi:hypothetical protein
MTQRFTYEITLTVRREGLLTLPIADVHVRGTLDAERDFARQLNETVAGQITRIRPKQEKARRP